MAQSQKQNMNILVTLNEDYIPYLNVMLSSLLYSNPDNWFTVYLLHSSVREEAMEDTVHILEGCGRLVSIRTGDMGLEKAPTTARYPQEIYYRIFAARYLPETVNRILYLDPDIIVNRPLQSLYSLPMDEYYFAAASHNGALMRMFNGLRLDMEENAPYINSGVMLMNLKLLREEQNYDEVFEFIAKRGNLLMLPDQDIISSLYGSKIYALDSFRYNMSEKLYRMHSLFEKSLDLDWVRNHSAIIHYCGKNKPWKPNYSGYLNIFYDETVARMGIGNHQTAMAPQTNEII